MIKLLTPIIAVGCFCVLSAYAYPRYTAQSSMSEGEFVAQKLAEYKPAKLVYVWKNKKAAQLAEVWGISPEELDASNSIWGQP